MKIRTGFVSNSSSSSFIVHGCDASKAKEMGLELISVRWLKERNRKLKKLETAKANIMKELPYFIGGYYYSNESDDMLHVNELDDDSFITEPYDRDCAYVEGISEYFETFKGEI